MLSPLCVGGEKKFLFPSTFYILRCHQEWEFHYKARGMFLTLHVPKPSLSKINHPKSHCIVGFKAILVTLTIKAKENGTTIIQMAESEANAMPCAPPEH